MVFYKVFYIYENLHSIYKVIYKVVDMYIKK